MDSSHKDAPIPWKVHALPWYPHKMVILIGQQDPSSTEPCNIRVRSLQHYHQRWQIICPLWQSSELCWYYSQLQIEVAVPFVPPSPNFPCTSCQYCPHPKAQTKGNVFLSIMQAALNLKVYLCLMFAWQITTFLHLKVYLYNCHLLKSLFNYFLNCIFFYHLTTEYFALPVTLHVHLYTFLQKITADYENTFCWYTDLILHGTKCQK